MTRPLRSFVFPLLRMVLLVALALLIAVGGGAATAWLAARSLDPVPDGAGWHALPDRATLIGDPYRRDPAGRRFGLEAGAGEKQLFVSTRSDDGAVLNSDCTYSLSGLMPPSRMWTLSALAPSLAPLDTNTRGLSSPDAVWQPDHSLVVTVGSAPAPGNWLRLPGDARRFVLLVGIYDLPSIDGSRQDEIPLPRVTRASCRNLPQ